MPKTTTIEWIPSADRLPEIVARGESELCLVVISAEMENPYIREGYRKQGSYDTYWVSNGNYFSDNRIKHWAPMPELDNL